MMIRSFLPVGQGAFYCEQFMWNFETERINIVYDWWFFNKCEIS